MGVQRGMRSYCDRCAKPVIDLTRARRHDLLRLYALEPETCGRFTLEQVEPDLKPLTLVSQQLLKGALATLTALILQTTYAQDTAVPTGSTEQTNDDRAADQSKAVDAYERCWIEKSVEPTAILTPSKPNVRYYWSKRFPFVHKRRQFRFIGCPSF